jgi:transcriptional regulator with XRE-family HTH domain
MTTIQLGDNVKRRRQSRGWSQAELAKMLDLGASQVSMIERGERMPSVEVLVALARTFETSIDDLLVVTQL